MPDPAYDSLIFPLASLPPNLTSLKRSTLTIRNRLVSILSDADFVTDRVAGRFPQRPLIANERCGSWYVPPGSKGGSAYFKSTDGHERAWKFSTRRLNLHLLDRIEENDGVIIVDSTRRGKRMPDALSTTIPIWCTVLNMALLPSHPLSSRLHLPPSTMPTTHAQITALLPEFLASFQALNLPLHDYKLSKPLRPFWVTRDSVLAAAADDDDGVIYEEYRPVICCTASKRVTGSEAEEGGYIQGAGDDTENWAHGLTPPVFWDNVDRLLATPEADLPDAIRALVESDKARSLERDHPSTPLTASIAVQQLPLPPAAAATAAGGATCAVALTSALTPRDTWVTSGTRMEVGLGKSKTASRNLRPALPDICAFAAAALDAQSDSTSTASPPVPAPSSPSRILVACDSGRDLSVGVALALDCRLFDDDGRRRAPGAEATFTKSLIKARLGAFMTRFPDANPSRSTLQSVNSFLMDWH